MDKQKKTKKNAVSRYFPSIFLVGIIVVCIAIGILIGSMRNKDDSIHAKESSSSTDSLSSEDTTMDIKIKDDTDPVTSSNPVTSSAPDKTEWNLILVNQWNILPEGYNPTVTQLKNGHAIDERAYPDLQKMMDDCRAAGLNPLICSSYRTMEKQKTLFSNKVNEYLAQGDSQEKAEEAAGKLVAVPGTSEHQLALALDIVDVSNQLLDESQENTPVQKWLMKNSWKYGFILRYPTDKSDITGIIYEPWHYRYVGKEAAKEIYDAGICLEEYLES